MNQDELNKSDQTFLFNLLGYIFIIGAAWLFFDSTRMTTRSMGYVLSFMPRGGFWDTTSMAIIFLPFLLGLFWLFYVFLAGGNFRWPKILSWSGLAIIAVEALSRVRFDISMKTSNFIILLGIFACGLAMLLRARILSGRIKAEANSEKGEK